MIHVNQIGYPVNRSKRAVLTPAAERFAVHDAESGKLVLEKPCNPPRRSPSAEETVSEADFSSLGAGRYYVKAGEEQSPVFTISEDPYAPLRASVLESFALQRCGEALDHAPWSHAACHTEPAMLYGTEKRYDVSGGWHDAGDYGRYTVPAATTVADLLWAVLLSPKADPGILSIVRKEMDWILKMRDEAGAVFHKVSCAHFCGFVQPDEEREPLVLCPVSSTATASCAAAMALGSRAYRAADPAYADTLLKAARESYQWLKEHPDFPPFRNPEGVLTGEYGDDNDKDERYWAACELYAATGEETYREDARTVGVQTGFGWRESGYFGSLALLFAGQDKAAEKDEFLSHVRDSLLAEAEKVMEAYRQEPYGISLGMLFPWGSNMDVANNALLLLAADKLEPSAAFRRAAEEHLHYILGCNAVGICYVSGFGTVSPDHLHHRPSGAASKTMPGLLAGGPSSGLEDDYIRSVRTGFPPQKRYADDGRSYATNEITIYWNSALYALLALLLE